MRMIKKHAKKSGNFNEIWIYLLLGIFIIFRIIVIFSIL